MPEHAPPSQTRQPIQRRLLRSLATLVAAIEFVCAPAASLAQINGSNGRPSAAAVVASSGDTRLMRPSALLTPLRAGEPIRAGDRVLTGDDGRVQLRFMDGALVAVQPGSDFKVEEFRYDTTLERSFVSLARGAIRTVTGAIGKRNHDDYRLRTPTATIGIRGTDFETIETPCGAIGCRPGERPGLTVTVYKGRVAVTNDTGTTEVPEGATLRVRSRGEAPSFGLVDPPVRGATPGARPGGRNGKGSGAATRGNTGPGGGRGGDGRLIEGAPALY